MLYAILILQFSEITSNLTVLPSREVETGSNITFICQYDVITNLSALTIKWEFRNSSAESSKVIWLFYAQRSRDVPMDGMKDKYIRIASDVMKGHIIQLNSAEVSDEGTYFCHLEYYAAEYVDINAMANLTIIGLTFLPCICL